MAEATTSDKFAQVRGFRVDITGATGGDVDSAWETLASGEANAKEKFHTTAPGHKSIEEITLRGAMTAGRKALCAWINETVQGKDWRRNVTVTVDTGDGAPPAQYIYFDCFPTRYVFPGMEDPEVREEVSFTYRSVQVVRGT